MPPSIMGDELGVDSLVLNVLDGAGSVDAGGADALGLGLVPVEGDERPAELSILVAVEEGAEFNLGGVVGDLPDADEVARGGKEIGVLAFLVKDKGGLGGALGQSKERFGSARALPVE
ncbi:hypothetical protein NL676_010106 [Syzygium grande]|nr:hypothetical protein NL676_010106 [Syzygium grande]